MDEKKLIEEMASDMDYACTGKDLYPEDAKEIAKALYLLNYRKIPEGSVVLTREEFENFGKDCKNCPYALDWYKETLRKETAKEIFERVKRELDNYRLDNEYLYPVEPDENIWQISSSLFYLEVIDDGGLIDQISKHYGVEVE